MAAGDLNGPIGEAFARLVGLPNTPDDVVMLAPHYEAELYYRLLQSPMGKRSARSVSEANGFNSSGQRRTGSPRTTANRLSSPI